MNDLFKNTEKPFKLVDINDIKPEIKYSSDYCTIKVLKDDILKNGLLQPLIVRKEHRIVELGNQRYTVLEDLKISKIPVRFKE